CGKRGGVWVYGGYGLSGAAELTGSQWSRSVVHNSSDNANGMGALDIYPAPLTITLNSRKHQECLKDIQSLKRNLTITIVSKDWTGTTSSYRYDVRCFQRPSIPMLARVASRYVPPSADVRGWRPVFQAHPISPYVHCGLGQRAVGRYLRTVFSAHRYRCFRTFVAGASCQ